MSGPSWDAHHLDVWNAYRLSRHPYARMHTASPRHVDGVLPFGGAYMSEDSQQALVVDDGRCLLFLRVLHSGRIHVFITVSQHG